MVLQTEFAQIKGNDLYIDDVKATDLVKQYGSPLYVMSEGHIRKQFNTLKTKMIDKYENTLPLFASKSFSCKAIYKLAMEYGVGIDCVSAGEISVALKAGFDPKKIYFHGNNKLPSEIQYALENGVENFVIDNFYEIELVEEIASKLNVMVNGLVRITPGVYAGGHDYIRVGAKDTKFGFSSHDNTYLKAIKKVIDAPHINFDGIHCHVGSQIEEIQAYVLAMNKFVDIAYEIYDIFGIVINKLNAGGGFGIQYTASDHPLEFDDVVSTIMDIIYKGFDRRNMKRPMVLVEPGRYCVGNAGITSLGTRYKVRHRAEFGISILKEFWGLGIGKALTNACISCAKEAGYEQLELEVVAENTSAVALYKKAGFVEFGRNPKGFKSRISGYQELVSMRLELDK